MIAYIEGKLIKKYEDRILILANQVGYEVLLPVMVMETIKPKQEGEMVSLFIYHHQTERQPKPVLIGFNLEAEKDFFQSFISVDAIGPLKAVKALTIPISQIAGAIESGDLKVLQGLSGIGKRTAQKIVASLHGKMGRFAAEYETHTAAGRFNPDFVQTVIDVLVSQLGHKIQDARRMVDEAIKRNSDINSAEMLFDEVYKGQAS